MYDLYDEYKEYVRWRNVIDDSRCSPWEVWIDLGKFPSQEKFMRGIAECNLIKERLCVRAFRSETDHSQVIDYGLRKQFYIPDITGWDMTVYKTPESYIDGYDQKGIKKCPFCGGEAVLECNQELRYGGEDGYYIRCTECGMNTTNIDGFFDRIPGRAIEKWNRRVGSSKI